jgi:hypothetical protein
MGVQVNMCEDAELLVGERVCQVNQDITGAWHAPGLM